MDNKKIAKEALQEIEDDKAKKVKEEFKQYFSDTLQEMEIQKKNKETAEEKIRILKKDLDDLKEGNLAQIKERQEKSPLAKETSRVIIKNTIAVKVIKADPNWFHGTYNVPLNWTLTNASTFLSTTNTADSGIKTFYF